MFSHQRFVTALGTTLAASLFTAATALAASSFAFPGSAGATRLDRHQGELVLAQLERIGPKQDDPRALKPNPNRGSLAIRPKQDDPRQGIIVQGGRGSGLAIGPKQDDSRALKPNPEEQTRGLKPNPN